MAKQDNYVRYTLRMPATLYENIRSTAGEKSINAEIVTRLNGDSRTLRDWFAGQALTEFASFINVKRSAETSKVVAALSYELADAMIAARSRPEEDNG